MALHDDLVSARELWKAATGLSKTLIVLSTFLAIAPIASLSQTIIEWHGFVLDAVNAYKNGFLVLS